MSEKKNKHNWVTKVGVINAGKRVSIASVSSKATSVSHKKGIVVSFTRGKVKVNKEISVEKLNESFQNALTNG